MKKDFLKRTLTPIAAAILCIILHRLGYGIGVLAMPIILLASAIEFGKGTFGSLGFQRERLKLFDLLVVAPLLAGGLFLLYWFVLMPGAIALTGQTIDFSAFASYQGDLQAVLGLTLFVWISAAFGEEIVYRGYFMRQFKKLFGEGRISIVLNILILGVIFGSAHSYQGISGMIVAGTTGAIFAVIFYFRKDDLWFNIALHGFFDTIAMVLVYRGV